MLFQKIKENNYKNMHFVHTLETFICYNNSALIILHLYYAQKQGAKALSYVTEYSIFNIMIEQKYSEVIYDF